ncbi:pseudouridine synthase [Serinicoccus chungangensis]|uniref:RNA pseudouridylate synthase n=1 Tax=Serinicoccus chungangensis TaxID=767452 RepID=A0A0W8I892_9MICO|nr:pseudouridine synthase [Serinicoccus chungangensis]KUG55611.1 pseudouridine synthase [Serinicoccus chungangensis]
MPRRPRPEAPLPPRDGLGPARVRMPVGATDPGGRPWGRVVDFLVHVTGDPVGIGRRLTEGEIALGDGSTVTAATAYRPGSVVYLYRDLPVEVPVPFEVDVLLHDEDTGLLVVDKPPFLATAPRGGHVAQTVLVRLRRALDLPELAPAHRLDRLTSGVLLLTTRRAARGAYQTMVQEGGLSKTYEAVAPVRPDLVLPTTVVDRIVKARGDLTARVVPGTPNARTRVELVGEREGLGRYRLTPTTGRTHQLRVHLAGLGVPIVNDPLYPEVREVDPTDFGSPLQLLARQVRFRDPVSGEERVVTSRRTLPILGAPATEGPSDRTEGATGA